MNVAELIEAVLERDRLGKVLDDLAQAYFEARKDLDPDWVRDMGSYDPTDTSLDFCIQEVTFRIEDKVVVFGLEVFDIPEWEVVDNKSRQVPFEDLLLDPRDCQDRWRAESAERLAKALAERDRMLKEEEKEHLELMTLIKEMEENLFSLKARAEQT